MRLTSLLSVALVLTVALLGCGGGGTAGGTGGTSGAGGAGGDDSCHAGCTATLAANCAAGPATQAKCESDCAMLLTGACGTPYRALQACAVGQPITCSAQGLPTVAACMTQQNAFVGCLNP